MLVQAVERFVLSPAAAAAHIAALAQLTASRATVDAAAICPSLPCTAAWGSTVLQAAQEELGLFVEQVGFGSDQQSCQKLYLSQSCLAVARSHAVVSTQQAHACCPPLLQQAHKQAHNRCQIMYSPLLELVLKMLATVHMRNCVPCQACLPVQQLGPTIRDEPVT